MNVGGLNLSAKWESLVNAGSLNRPYKDEHLDIEYGVRLAPDGNYAFFVSGKENNESAIEDDFIEEKPAGIFLKQFNRLRKLRPGGEDRKPGRQDDLPAGVEKCGFYCQDPANSLSLLVRPLLGTVASVGSHQLHFSWNVYPNLAPFEPGGHFLLLPSGTFPELPHFPQLLTPFLVEDFLDLCQASSQLMLFFNSRHAGASQDHFHLQAVCHASKLPIEKAEQQPFGSNSLRRIGGNYPVNALVYAIEDKKRCCQHVMKLQTKGIPFNLLFLKGDFFLVPRDINNEIVSEFPTALGSMEISGKFIIPDKEVFEKACEEHIRAALGKIGLPPEDIM